MRQKSSKSSAGKSKPVSLRLGAGEIEQLQARAYSLNATVTGVARDLIRAGLAGGDNKSLADRLMRIERRLAALEQQGTDTHVQSAAIDRTARELLAKFNALLQALTGQNPEKRP